MRFGVPVAAARVVDSAWIPALVVLPRRAGGLSQRLTHHSFFGDFALNGTQR